MKNRLILAVGLSLFVLIVWSILFPVPKSQPIVNKEVMENKTTTSSPSSSPSSSALTPIISPETSSFVYNKSDFIEVIFSLPSASIREVNFKKFNYKSNNIELIGLLSDNDKAISFSDYKINDDKVVFYSQNHKIIKTFYIPKSSYIIGLEISGINKTGRQNIWLNICDNNLLKNSREAKTSEYTIFSGAKPEKLPLYRFKNQSKTMYGDSLRVAGIHGTHFCYLLKNKELGKNELKILSLGDDKVRLCQGIVGDSFDFYLGPQEKEHLYGFDPIVSDTLAYFNPIAKAMLYVLQLLHLIVRNWGLAIILLSLLIYGLLYPLTHKQMQSMKEMQALQPHIDNLRKIYKDNPQKLNKEIMELYKEHKVNPLGGCLPLLLQIPIFFALYQALSKSLLLKGAKFLWMKDLTEPDKLFILPKTLPIIGNEINLLPILMALTMFLQQKLSLKSASPSQREQQQMMMVIFPIIFGFIFYSFPAGLVIYWFINSLLTLVYQWKVSK